MDIVFLTHDDELIKRFKTYLSNKGITDRYVVHSVSAYKELYYNHTGSELSENVLKCINFYVPKIRKDFNDEVIFVSLSHGISIAELPHLGVAFTNFYNLNAKGNPTLLKQIVNLTNKKATLKRTVGVCTYLSHECVEPNHIDIRTTYDEGCMKNDYGKDTTLEEMFVPYEVESELSLNKIFSYIISNYY